MRSKAILSIIVLLTTASVIFANSDPVVSGVSVIQRNDSKLVDISYNLSDADGDKCSVSVQVSSDGGSTWTVPAVSFTGAVGSNISPGSSKLITWDCSKDLPGIFGSNYRIKVTASDISSIPNMVYIPAGTFSMGDSFSEGEWYELPVHSGRVAQWEFFCRDSISIKILSKFKVFNQVGVKTILLFDIDTNWPINKQILVNKA